MSYGDEVIIEAFDAQHGFDASDEFPFFEGFADVVIGSNFQAFDTAGGIGSHGDEHDGNEGVDGHSLDDPACFDSAESGHEDIEQHEVHAPLAHDFYGFLSVRGGKNLMSSPAQDGTDGLSSHAVIVGHHHLGGAGGWVTWAVIDDFFGRHGARLREP